MIKIIALFGKSGAGKDSLLDNLMIGYPELNLHKIVADTSRPMREGEVNGKQYNFVTNREFDENISHNKILEYTVYNDYWYYGTNIDSLNEDKINIGIFNPASISKLMRMNNIQIIPIMIDANDKERLIRQLKREQSPNCHEICRRYLADEKDFSAIAFKYNRINNENFCLATFNLADLIKSLT